MNFSWVADCGKANMGEIMEGLVSEVCYIESLGLIRV